MIFLFQTQITNPNEIKCEFFFIRHKTFGGAVMKRTTTVVTDRRKLNEDLLVAHLLVKLMQEGIINQATYIKAESEVAKNVRKQ